MRVRVAAVERFVSHYTNRLDAKGRVSIPAPFRLVLARDGFEGLYVHPSLDLAALDCGGHQIIAEIQGLLERFSPYSEERDFFALALEGASELLKTDTEGRIVLSDTLKQRAGITTGVVFVGLGHKFQIWEPGRFHAHLEEATTRLRDFRKQLSAGPVTEPTVFLGNISLTVVKILALQA